MASFTDAVFRYDVYFRSDKGGTFAGAVDFNGAVFDRTADFSGRTFNQTTDFRRASFKGLPLFYDCQLVTETLFDIRANFVSRPWLNPIDDPTMEHNIEREERERVRRRKIRFNDMGHRMREVRELPPKVVRAITLNGTAKSYELAFRTLRQLSATVGNLDDEMDFHALELEARRARSDVALFERGVIVAYKGLSDYGRSMWRPIWVFLMCSTATVSAVAPIVRHAIKPARLSARAIDIPSYVEIVTYLFRNFIPPPPV